MAGEKKIQILKLKSVAKIKSTERQKKIKNLFGTWVMRFLLLYSMIINYESTVNSNILYPGGLINKGGRGRAAPYFKPQGGFNWWKNNVPWGI